MANARIGALRVDLGLNSAAFEKGLSLIERRMSKFSKDMGKLGDKFSSIGEGLTKNITLPVIAAGAGVLKVAGDFESSMNRVEAATGAAGKELSGLREQALAFGQDRKFTATAKEAADAMEILAKNGLTAKQIMGGAAAATLTLAAATGSEFGPAADLATDVMQQFGKNANDLDDVVDKVTGALLVSKFGFDDYRMAIGQAGGVAGGLGLKFEDLNVAIAATSAYFSSGSDAGTSFKTFLLALTPSTKAAAAAMEQYGLTFFDASGNMKSLADISEMLKTQLGGLNDEAKNEVLKTIFGTDALRTAIGLMEQGAAGIQKIDETINNASALDQAAARTKGFEGAMKQLTKSLEGLAIAIADSGFLEAVTNLILKFSDFVRGLSTTEKSVLGWSVAIAAAVAAIGPFLMGIGGIISAVGTVAPLFGKLAPVLKVLPTLLSAVGVAFRFMLGPIGLAITAIGLAYYAWKNWDKIEPIIKRLYNAVKTWVVDKLNAIWDGVKKRIEAVKGYFYDLYDAVVGNSYVPDMVDGIADQMARLEGVMVKPSADATNRTSQAFEAMAQRVRGILDRLFPEARVNLDFAADKAALEALVRAGEITEQQFTEAMRRLLREYHATISELDNANVQAILPVTGDEIPQMFADNAFDWGTILDGMRDKAETTSVQIAESFRDMANRTLESFSQLANSIKSGGFLGILESVIGLGLQLGSVGVFGKKVQASLNKVPGRAVGGPVKAASTYLVGEKGPELFTSGVNGRIIPNDRMGGGGRPIMFDLRGAVLTEDLLRQMNTMAAQATVQGGQLGADLAQARGARSNLRRVR